MRCAWLLLFACCAASNDVVLMRLNAGNWVALVEAPFNGSFDGTHATLEFKNEGTQTKRLTFTTMAATCAVTPELISLVPRQSAQVELSCSARADQLVLQVATQLGSTTVTLRASSADAGP